MELITVLAVGFLCMSCFFLGAKVGQTVTKGETIKLPSINTVQAVKDFNARKEATIEQTRFETIMQNIEKYDGTSLGQVDVP